MKKFAYFIGAAIAIVALLIIFSASIYIFLTIVKMIMILLQTIF